MKKDAKALLIEIADELAPEGSRAKKITGMKGIKRSTWIIIALIATIVLAGPVEYWRHYKGCPLSMAAVYDRPIAPRESIPRGPGTSHVRILGPATIPPVFKIDLDTPGIVPIPYEDLIIRMPNAEVKVRIRVVEGGRVQFKDKDDVQGAGEARLMIVSAMRTWRFEPYKRGTIRYYFHLGTAGKKLTIQGKLEKSARFRNKIMKRDGRLYFGVPDDRVDQGGEVIW